MVEFADHSFSERIGWREIVVLGSGVTLAASGDGALRTSSPSNRLTLYPTKLLAQALADTQVAILATPGGPLLPAVDIPDAEAVAGSAAGGPAADAGPAASAVPADGAVNGSTDVKAIDPEAVSATAVVPGGVTAGDLPSIFRTADLTPPVLPFGS